MWYVRQPAEIVHRRRDSGLTLCWKVPLALLIWSLWATPLVAVLAAWVTVRTYTADLPPVPDVAQAEALLPQTSYILASDGTVLAEIPFRDGEVVGHRVLVSAHELPETLVSALLAAEDVRFFEHRGVDARAVLRAAIANYEAGAVVEGASTITQQVVRALLPERIGYERSLRRKVREAVLAWRLERVYGKHQILQIYANQVFLGANAYGVAAAARAYFNKPLAELDLAQVAMIAGLVQAPGRADPYRDRAAARARRDQVLARMERAGLASSAEVAAAMAQPIALTSPPLAYGSLAPWHTERVRREVEATWPEAYQRGGLRIESAAEPGLSLLAEDTARAWLGRLAGGAGAAGPQVGALIWDYQSGYVEATLGGRSFAESRFDRATQACRQPGSAFKPLVYAAALAADIITPATILRDAPITVYDDARDVFWATGAALVVRREAFEAAGGFDESFGMHMEEIDLCWRLQRAGGRIRVEPASEVYHLGGASLPQGNPRKAFYNFRNGLVMLAKNLPRREARRVLRARRLLDALAAARSWIGGSRDEAAAIRRAWREARMILQTIEPPPPDEPSVLPPYRKSLVLDYFARGRRRFSDLPADRFTGPGS